MKRIVIGAPLRRALSYGLELVAEIIYWKTEMLVTLFERVHNAQTLEKKRNFLPEIS